MSEQQLIVPKAEGVSEKVIFDATLQQCLDVITDYESYPEFLETLTEAKIVKKSKDGKVVDVYYKATIYFKTIEYTLSHFHNDTGLTWKHTDHGPFAFNTYVTLC